METLPETITNEQELNDLLTRPSAELQGFIRTLQSPLLILGAGGKMGPTLAVLAKRAAQAAGHSLEVIAVSRFGSGEARAWLEQRGVKTVVCDLLDRAQVAQLQQAPNVAYMVGLKFGTSENPALTWAVNTIVPALVAEHYASARIIALSTGNVYPMVHVNEGGAKESHPLTPIGEYPNAAVARERVFEYFSARNGTPMAILRLFYAVELRYGVLVDIAHKVFQREEIDLANGHFNCIWQGDANEMILRSLDLAESPARPWNLCNPAILSVREVATRLGQLLGSEPRFRGTESATSLVANSKGLCERLGYPATPLESVLRWTADWVGRAGRNFGKPTHFETRDGRY